MLAKCGAPRKARQPSQPSLGMVNRRQLGQHPSPADRLRRAGCGFGGALGTCAVGSPDRRGSQRASYL